MAKEFNDHQEKEFDDEVYEDDYYDNEEELSDDHEKEAPDEDAEEEEVKVHMSFACEDCDYRWEDVIVKIKGSLDAQSDDIEANCPMCGSTNVSQI